MGILMKIGQVLITAVFFIIGLIIAIVRYIATGVLRIATIVITIAFIPLGIFSAMDLHETVSTGGSVFEGTGLFGVLFCFGTPVVLSIITYIINPDKPVADPGLVDEELEQIRAERAELDAEIKRLSQKKG